MSPCPARAPLALVFVAGVLVQTGCAGGCAGFGPFPDAERYVGPKLDHAAAIRVAPGGFEQLNERWETILDQFAPGRQMTVPLACTVQSVTLIGDVLIADMGSAGCAAESCGLMDGVCDAKDLPKDVEITFHQLSLAPVPPDRVGVTVDLSISTGTFFVDSKSRNHGLCLFQNPFKCGVNYDTGRAAPPELVVQAQLQLVIDPRWDKVLSFEVSTLNGSQVCGTGSAPPKPQCLDPADLLITNAGSCSVCTGANWDPVKAVVLSQIAGSLKGALQDALDAQQCQRCTAAEPACPTLPGATSACALDGALGTCVDPVTSRCVPALLGVEGQGDLASMMGTLGGPAPANVALTLTAGGSASSDTGLNLGMRGAARELEPGACVKTFTLPPLVLPPAPQLAAEAQYPHDVAFSLSRAYLDQVSFAAAQAGALCLVVGTQTVSQLDTGLFKAFLPSLGLVQGEGDGPVAFALRPQRPPRFNVGKGELSPTGEILSPLLELVMEELELDLYAQVQGRMVRLFTLVVDVRLPFALQAQGCDGLQLVIGSLEDAISVTGTKNSELLAEDVNAFAELVPTFIALAEPALAGGLPVFALPPLGPVKAKVAGAHGVGPIPGTPWFEHAGIFAELLPVDEPCLAGMAKAFTATLVSLDAPAGKAKLGVGLGGAAQELQFRVNGGFWSTLRPAVAGQIEVVHPALSVPGRHLVELQARGAHPGELSALARVEVVVDLPAPASRRAPMKLRDALRDEAPGQ